MYEDWNENDSDRAKEDITENVDNRDSSAGDSGESGDRRDSPDGFSTESGERRDNMNGYFAENGEYRYRAGGYSAESTDWQNSADGYFDSTPGSDDRNETDNGESGSGGTEDTQYEHSEHSSQDRNFEYQPRWQPDTEKYNTHYDNDPKPEKKKRKKWWIPVAVILAAMIVVIAVIVSAGTDAVKDSIENSSTESQAAEAESADSSLILGDNVGTSDANKVSTSDAEGIILTDVSDVVEEVMPAVVSITARSLVNSSGSYWEYFYGGSADSSSEEVDSGYGSGTIVAQNDTELLILTSFHVVEDSSSFYVTFCDGSSAEAYLKSSAEDSDIAIVAVSLENITEETINEIKIATLSSKDVEVGEGVIVIGNALGYGQSVTTGIISAKDKEIEVEGKTVITIQTDAAINGGNSGGATLDANGNIIGISEAKIQSTSVEGMGYSISIYNYYDLIMELLTTETSLEDETTGDISEIGTGYLGIYGRDLSSQLASQYGLPTDQGVFVAGVVSDSGAEAAGLEAGDIIVGIDGTTITSMTDLQSAIATHSAGDTVTLDILEYSQDGYTEATVEVTLTAQIG